MIAKRKTLQAVLAVVAVLALIAVLAACGGAAQPTATEMASPAVTPSPTVQATTTASPQATEAPEETETPEATETAEPAQGMKKVDFENVHLTYNSDILGEATPGTIAENVPEGAPGFAITPKHIEIAFPGYPVKGDAFEPAVRVYRLSDYQALVPDLVGREVKYMQILLESRPDLAVVFPPAGPLQPPTEDQGYGPNPPFLPLVNAASDLRVKMEFMDFENGSGIRYITHFGQSPSPIEKEGVFFTYQGLSTDGQYWISATFPLDPADYPAPPEGWQNDIQKAQSYNQDLAGYLNGLAPQSYTPSLADLDGLVKSMRVESR